MHIYLHTNKNVLPSFINMDKNKYWYITAYICPFPVLWKGPVLKRAKGEG